MNVSHKNRQKGLTLVETLIASIILAVGLLAVSTMIARSTIQDSRAYLMTKASTFIEEHIEQESHKQNTDTDFDSIQSTTSPIIKSIDGIKYSINCVVKDNTPLPFCKEMTCSAEWNNKGINSRTSYAYDFCRY